MSFSGLTRESRPPYPLWILACAGMTTLFFGDLSPLAPFPWGLVKGRGEILERGIYHSQGRSPQHQLGLDLLQSWY
jgi:hypothetical protein